MIVVPIHGGHIARRHQTSAPLSVQKIWYVVIVTFVAISTWMIACIVHVTFSTSSLDGFRFPRKHARETNRVKKSDNIKQSSKKALPKGHIDYSDYKGPSTTFRRFNHPFPCFRGEKQLMIRTISHEGLLFQRPMKTGSTTITGILLRLVHNRGQMIGYEKCKHRTMHGSGIAYDFGRRVRSKSFLFSIIRDPQARAISQFFHFQVSVGMKDPTDTNIQKDLLQNYNHLHYLDDLRLRNYTNPKDYLYLRKHLAVKMGYKSIDDHAWAIKESKPEIKRHFERKWKKYMKFGSKFNPHQIIGHILEDYDLIAIMERMDESLVVLQMLLNLSTKEILYTRARSGGSFSNGYKSRPCIYILPSFISPSMKTFLESDEWKEHIAPDVEFYKAAHKSLDRTIEALGRKEFEKNLALFKKGQKLAAEQCTGRVRTMCSSAGEVIRPVNTTCYIWGEGCDHDCIDELDL
jgi:Sulfotransferase family